MFSSESLKVVSSSEACVQARFDFISVWNVSLGSEFILLTLQTVLLWRAKTRTRKERCHIFVKDMFAFPGVCPQGQRL